MQSCRSFERGADRLVARGEDGLEDATRGERRGSGVEIQIGRESYFIGDILKVGQSMLDRM